MSISGRTLRLPCSSSWLSSGLRAGTLAHPVPHKSRGAALWSPVPKDQLTRSQVPGALYSEVACGTDVHGPGEDRTCL